MNKKNLLLGGILVLLVAVAYLWQGPVRDFGEKRNRAKNFLAGFDIASISRIEISRGETITAAIEKAGDKWRIAGTKEFYVKDDIMAGVMSALQSAAKADLALVGTNKEKKSQFNTHEGGSLVKLIQGERLAVEFIVGKMTQDFQNTYISQPNSEKTYKVPVNLAGILVRNDWYDNSIFSTEEDIITKVRLQYPAREFTVEREITVKTAEGEEPENIVGDWVGVLPYKFRVSGEKMEKILGIMSNLTAAEVPPQVFEGTGLEKNNIIVEATGEGVNNTIMIGDAVDPEDENSLYYAKRGDSDNIYLITKEQRDELEKQTWDLR